MSTQELDVRWTWMTLRRQSRVVGAAAAVGLLLGVTLGLLFPAWYTAAAVVVLPPASASGGAAPTQDTDTQVLIAGSAPVLASAGQNLHPPQPANALKDRVEVSAVTQDVLRITARGRSAAEAERLANAVADTYVFYVTDSDGRLPGDLGKKIGARVLERATAASGGSIAVHLASFGLLGATAGAVLGAIGVLAVARGDRRLRLREEIADAIGVPVLASVSSHRPSGAAGWAELIDGYRPSAVDAWSLRKTLHHLGLDPRADERWTVSVVSFAEDQRALCLGPQLAAFSASLGVPAALVVDTHHEAAAALIAVGSTVVGGAGRNRGPVAVAAGPAGQGSEELSAPEEAATNATVQVLVVVVDKDRPRLTDTTRASTTVLAVSAGSVTAEELARLAVAVAEEGRSVDGIIVLDPDTSDRTTGRAPLAARRGRSGSPTPLAARRSRT